MCVLAASFTAHLKGRTNNLSGVITIVIFISPPTDTLVYLCVNTFIDENTLISNEYLNLYINIHLGDTLLPGVSC